MTLACKDCAHRQIHSIPRWGIYGEFCGKMVWLNHEAQLRGELFLPYPDVSVPKEGTREDCPLNARNEGC